MFNCSGASALDREAVVASALPSSRWPHWVQKRLISGSDLWHDGQVLKSRSPTRPYSTQPRIGYTDQCQFARDMEGRRLKMNAEAECSVEHFIGRVEAEHVEGRSRWRLVKLESCVVELTFSE